MELLFIVAPFLVATGCTVLIIRWATARELLDVPNERSSHQVPRPRLGGIAIFAGCLTGFLLLHSLEVIALPPVRVLTAFYAAAILLWIAGTGDDFKNLPASLRLIVQVVAGLIMVWGGLGLRIITLPAGEALDLGILGSVLTVVWVVAFVNFYNFIDGIDGLAGGGAVVASTFLFLFSLYLGLPFLAVLSLVVASSTLGFLRFNFPPAKIFMGDGGSTFLGFFFAFSGLYGLHAGRWGEGTLPPFLVILLVGALLADAAVTLIRRMIAGEKWYRPHRTHFYQRLVSLGLTHKQVVLIFYAVSILMGASAFAYLQGGQAFAITLVAIWVLLFSMGMMKIHSMETGSRMFWERRTMLVIGADLFFFAAAYLLAFVLRLNFQFPDAETAAMWKGLPIMLGARSFSFYYYRIYRRSWRLTGPEDLSILARAVTLGTILSYMAMWFLFRLESFPRSVIGIEWFILMVLVTGSRVGARLFHEMTGEKDRAKAIIVGAGARGQVVVQEMRHRTDPGYLPVGFLDDAPEKQTMSYQGVSVLGETSQVVSVCRTLGVRHVFLALPGDAEEKNRRIRDYCATAGLTCHGALESDDMLRLDSPPSPGEIELLLDRRDLPDLTPRTRRFFTGRTVLLAGGAGDFGRELAVQLASLSVERVIVVDRSEERLEAARTEIGEEGSTTFLLGDLHDLKWFRNLLPETGRGLVVFLAGYAGEPRHGSLVPFFRNNLVLPLEIAGICEDRKIPMVFRASAWLRAHEVAFGAAEAAVETALRGKTTEAWTRTIRVAPLLSPRGVAITTIRRNLDSGKDLILPRAWRDRFGLTVREGAHAFLEASSMLGGDSPLAVYSPEPLPLQNLVEKLASLRGFKIGRDLRLEWEKSTDPGKWVASVAGSLDSAGLPHIFFDRRPIRAAIEAEELLEFVEAADETGLALAVDAISRQASGLRTRQAGAST